MRKIDIHRYERLRAKKRFQNEENSFIHMDREVEKLLMEFVRMGDYKTLERLIHERGEAFTFDIIKRSSRMAKRELKHFEYAAVATIAVATREAVRGGLNHTDAYDYSDVFLSELEDAKNIKDMIHVMCSAMYCLSKKVSEEGRKGGSYIVKKCKGYIKKHLHSRIYVKDIVNSLGMNQSYISKVFSQEEGCTLQNYILEQKVGAAKEMIKYSGESFGNISQNLSFSSPSHFTTVFEKFTGMSPREFKNKIEC